MRNRQVLRLHSAQALRFCSGHVLRLRSAQAQTAIEYLILLALVTIIVLVGFSTFLPRSQKKTEAYFNAAVNGIMGDPPEANPLRTNYP